MQSPVSGLASLLRNTSWITRQGHLRRFDEAITRFVDGNFNRHFFEVCFGAQADGASASHEISHMRLRVLLVASCHFENCRGEGPGDEVAIRCNMV